MRAGRERAGLCAVASGVMAEAGVMVPTSGSELTGWSKVSVVLQWRMSMHERLRTTTLIHHCCRCSKRARTMHAWAALFAWVHESEARVSRVSVSVGVASGQRVITPNFGSQVVAARVRPRSAWPHWNHLAGSSPCSAEAGER